MKSIFVDKDSKPTTSDLERGLGETFNIWKSFEAYTKKHHPHVTCEWNFSGDKFGWSYRIKDKKKGYHLFTPKGWIF